MKVTRHFLIVLLFFLVHASFAQQSGNFHLNIEVIDQPGIELKKLARYRDTYRDSLELYDGLNEMLLQLYAGSYLSASIDELIRDSLNFLARIRLGEQYHWATLRKGNVDEEVLSKTGYRDKFFNRSPFSHRQLTRLFERIIVLYENNGYPFAMVRLDSIEFNRNNISASLNLEKHRFLRIDSIVIHGDAKINKNYIYNYLSVKPKDSYNEGNVKKISVRLSESPFLTESKPFNVAFTETKTILNLFLKNRNANLFDGIIGILPNEDDGKIEFTGDVKLRLQNSFRQGELIDFNWRKLVSKSQDLKFRFNYPYLFNTPFGIDFDFKLYRRDTLFLDLYTKYGVHYSWKANNYFGVFYNRKNSNLLSTNIYKNNTTLPPYADIRSSLYGVNINLERLNYRLNPRKGYSALLEAEAGTKKIRKNNDLNPIIYDGLQLNSVLYNFRCDLDFYIPLTKVMVINLGNQSAYTYNENIFENELFRIGGLRILRGFDEESIFTSVYTVNTIEYRIILERNSYWYLFFDGAYYENNNVNLEKKITDTPYGFGTGITFQVRSGIFSLNYALGKQFSNPILFRAAKIHFGFVNYF